VPIKLQLTDFKERIEYAVNDLLLRIPDAEQLNSDQRRGVIARYAAVLEGNFIYWMTAALLAVRTDEARSIIMENLREEVRDCHPGMMRRFARAAKAFPTDSDALGMDRELTNVRRFAGQQSGVQMVVMMTFFEAFIQRFMPFLAEVARRQGSEEFEYTTVHGVCDIAHTENLLQAIEAEARVAPPGASTNLFEGIDLLTTLVMGILRPAQMTETAMSSAG